MIKIYLDWNVLSQIKNGYHNELRKIIFDNERLFIPFSTSHIGDILSSFNETDTQREYIESDLDFISKLTSDKCLLNTGKDIMLVSCQPKEVFEERIEEKDLFNDLSLDGLMSVFEQDGLTKSIGESLTTLLKSIPLEESFKQALENPESAEQLNKIFPRLRENPTIEVFFKSFSKMNFNLNESDGYKELRKIVQAGMGLNRDKIFDSDDPYQIIDERYKKIGISPNQHINNSKNAPEWFNKITNEYLLLDMHGYQEDRVNIKKGRKETYKNTTEDSFHAAFASTCNFYIVNDNKSYKKTKLIYKKLQINTLVLNPSEFVEYYQKYLDIEDILLNFRIPFEIIKTNEFYEEVIDTATTRTYYVPYYFFDFFNKIIVHIPNDNGKMFILLGQNILSNQKVYSIEIQHLYKQLSKILGTDIENLGEVKDEEFKEDEWIGRKWKFDEVALRLTRLNGHFQLFFEW